MGLLNIQVYSDIADYQNALNDFQVNMQNIERFIGGQVTSQVRQLILSTIMKLARRAGNFPIEYLDHLLGYFATHTEVRIVGTSNGSVEVTVGGWEGIGDKEELTLGYHDQALLGQQYDGENWDSIHIGHKGHSQRNQVDLPWWGGENDSELMSPQPLREAFWKQVIIGRDVEGWISHMGNPGIQAAMRNKILVNLPTYNEVAAKRVAVWVEAGVAPEWLLLQYGAPGTPAIRPVGFAEKLDAVIACATQQLSQQAYQTIYEIYQREKNLAGVGKTGRPFEIVPRKGGGTRPSFVSYVSVRESFPIDLSSCIGVV